MKKTTKTLRHAMVAFVSAVTTLPVLATPPVSPFAWQTVVNNNYTMPSSTKKFSSYNQPSVNVDGLVVIRARSKGESSAEGDTRSSINAEQGNQPIHGIYTRDMSTASDIKRILDRTTPVPEPNNLGTTFIETPSFPRIDMISDTIATRGNHKPVWAYTPESGTETRVGTTGIYTNPFDLLITGASKLGAVPAFDYFAVPGLQTDSLVMFDVFPGAPAVTGGSTIVFKGNYTVDDAGKTGVFYRELVNQNVNGATGGGSNSVVLIANNTDTEIPDTNQIFGSISPPSAADGKVVFAGFDNEESPNLGGIYQAELRETPDLIRLVGIGDRVPGETNPNARFNELGEGVAFDGRYVGFWGSWGPKDRTTRLHCPTEGNKARIAYCHEQCPEPAGCTTTIPTRQGIFVHDTANHLTMAVAKAPNNFLNFLFWNFSGKVPGNNQDGEDDGDGEPARWRSSAFVAVSGTNTAFKAVTGNRLGIYLSRKPGQTLQTVLDTQMPGQSVDPEAPTGSNVSDVGLEREGLRGKWLAINVKMEVAGGSEENSMAGVYITTVDPE